MTMFDVREVVREHVEASPSERARALAQFAAAHEDPVVQVLAHEAHRALIDHEICAEMLRRFDEYIEGEQRMMAKHLARFEQFRQATERHLNSKKKGQKK